MGSCCAAVGSLPRARNRRAALAWIRERTRARVAACMGDAAGRGGRVTRTFADSPAVRSHVPVLLGLYGASGGGKTFSALRLAAGIQRVQGGDVYVIDTEANRALHYADKFRFRHVPFGAPFSPADYLDAIQHCVGKRAGVVIVDSMSHEHEGPGGVLEMHDAELTRLSRGDDSARDRNNMRAWVRPKAERRRLINTILQLPASMIF